MGIERLYIGPLEFRVECGEAYDALRFPALFERDSFPFDYVSYDVRILSREKIPPRNFEDEKSRIKFDSFREYRSKNSIVRDYFGCGCVTDCFARSRLCGHELEICVRGDIKRGNAGVVEEEINRTHGIWEFLMLEKLLAGEGAFILHSASVVSNGKAILFSAPSGTGKSTQADLWKKYVPGTTGFNGDRNLLVKRDGVWYICGFPWHGSSPDCENGVVPLAGIALLRQAEKDAVSELSEKEKFVGIYSGVTQNPWDRNCTAQLMGAVGELVRDVPVCRLSCTMGKSAVDCLKEWLNETIKGRIVGGKLRDS